MIRPKRTKIVATMGPASRDARTIENLIRAGVDVFRMNAAHLDHKSMARDVHAVRRAARKLKASVGVLVDLQGPKIRVGSFKDAEPIFLQRGKELVISCEPGVLGQIPPEGQPIRIGTRYPGLAEDVRAGERILLDDGNIELRVQSVEGKEIRTRVVYGGLLKQHKGINLPGTAVSAASLAEKDIGDLDAALDLGVDFIAVSFVREPEDIKRVKARIEAHRHSADVIAKIERPEAVQHLSKILEVCDAVMVARGDMGVELGAEAVPSVQKRIIREAIEVRKPVITATQMLESMVTNPRPTRAEASDVANAIYDGSSAVMMSAETASGKYPVRATRIMERIIRRTEADLFSEWEFTRRRRRGAKGLGVTMATVRAAAYGALLSDARLVAVFTESGRTAQLLCAEQIATQIYAFTPFQHTVQRLTLTWGVSPIKLRRTRSVTTMVAEAEEILVEGGILKAGDTYVVVVGTSRRAGVANIMRLRTVGDVD